MSNNLSRLDPRARRTRALLRDTLLELIRERGAYNNITIKDLTDRAEVSRTTFYLHFKTINDLLFETMRDIYEEIALLMEAEDEQYDANHSRDFEHVAQYADFYRVMLGPNGSPAFLMRLRQFLAATNARWLAEAVLEGQKPNIPLDLLGYYLAGAEIGVVHWWLENDMPFSPKDMAKMVKQVCFQGLYVTLDLPQEENTPDQT